MSKDNLPAALLRPSMPHPLQIRHWLPFHQPVRSLRSQLEVPSKCFRVWTATVMSSSRTYMKRRSQHCFSIHWANIFWPPAIVMFVSFTMWLATRWRPKLHGFAWKKCKHRLRVNAWSKALPNAINSWLQLIKIKNITKNSAKLTWLQAWSTYTVPVAQSIIRIMLWHNSSFLISVNVSKYI